MVKKPRIRTALALLALGLLASPAHAQDAIVTTAAPIYLLPDTMRTPLRTAAVNSRLRVLEETPEGWVKVEFRDPQFGMRVGYIEARFVRIVRPELAPMDLSVREEPPARVAAPPEGQPVATPVVQRATARRSFARGWIDVNFGVAVAGEKEYGSVLEGILHQETARFSADYRAPLGAEFDFGGGVQVVEITRYETERIDFDEATGWGAHAGADISIFLGRVIGLGGFAKFSRGRVRFLDLLTVTDSELKTGGFQAGGGLRLRF